MILMFPVTQGTLHLIGKLSTVFLLLQAGRFSWDISKKWPPKALSVPRTTSNWFLFLLRKQIMNLNFMCLVRLEHRDMHMQRNLIMIILSSWLRLAIRIGMFPRHGLSRLCIYAAQM